MKTTARIRKRAAIMLDDLDREYHEHVLIPAPDPQHSCHKIRVMQYRNPSWYSELCSAHVSLRGRGKKKMRIPRTYIVRSEVRKALERIAADQADGHVYDGRLVELIRRILERERRRPDATESIYKRCPDIPF